jgi:hypothetical protein
LHDALQAYKEMRAGVKPPGMWKTLFGVLSPLSGNTVNCMYCLLMYIQDVLLIETNPHNVMENQFSLHIDLLAHEVVIKRLG